jgi:hypothetical protein
LKDLLLPPFNRCLRLTRKLSGTEVTAGISADCLVGDLDTILLSPCDDLRIAPVPATDFPFARELAHLRNPERLPDLIGK